MRVSFFRTLQYLTFVLLLGWWIFLNKNVSNNFYGEDGFFSVHDGSQHQSLEDIDGRDVKRIRYTRGRKFGSTSRVIQMLNGMQPTHVLLMKTTANRTLNGTNISRRTIKRTSQAEWLDETTVYESKRQPRRKSYKKKISRQWRELEGPQLLLPKPVIVMGFPKAGTSSIFAFFQRLHVPSQHW